MFVSQLLNLGHAKKGAQLQFSLGKVSVLFWEPLPFSWCSISFNVFHQLFWFELYHGFIGFRFGMQEVLKRKEVWSSWGTAEGEFLWAVHFAAELSAWTQTCCYHWFMALWQQLPSWNVFWAIWESSVRRKGRWGGDLHCASRIRLAEMLDIQSFFLAFIWCI